MELNIKARISAAELEKAIRFLYNDDETVERVIQQYFSADPIIVDFSEIEDPEAKTYHRNGFIAVLINLINTNQNSEQC